MEPPQRATFTVSPMDMLSRALLAVRTLAKVALRMPSTQTTLLMHAPIRKVMPLLFSTNREKMTASTATTMAIVRYSVFIKVLAPLRIMPAISTMSLVPSGIFLIRT